MKKNLICLLATCLSLFHPRIDAQTQFPFSLDGNLSDWYMNGISPAAYEVYADSGVSPDLQSLYIFTESPDLFYSNYNFYLAVTLRGTNIPLYLYADTDKNPNTGYRVPSGAIGADFRLKLDLARPGQYDIEKFDLGNWLLLSPGLMQAASAPDSMLTIINEYQLDLNALYSQTNLWGNPLHFMITSLTEMDWIPDNYLIEIPHSQSGGCPGDMDCDCVQDSVDPNPQDYNIPFMGGNCSQSGPQLDFLRADSYLLSQIRSILGNNFNVHLLTGDSINFIDYYNQNSSYLYLQPLIFDPIDSVIMLSFPEGPATLMAEKSNLSIPYQDSTGKYYFLLNTAYYDNDRDCVPGMNDPNDNDPNIPTPGGECTNPGNAQITNPQPHGTVFSTSPTISFEIASNNYSDIDTTSVNLDIEYWVNSCSGSGQQYRDSVNSSMLQFSRLTNPNRYLVTYKPAPFPGNSYVQINAMAFSTQGQSLYNGWDFNVVLDNSHLKGVVVSTMGDTVRQGSLELFIDSQNGPGCYYHAQIQGDGLFAFYDFSAGIYTLRTNLSGTNYQNTETTFTLTDFQKIDNIQLVVTPGLIASGLISKDIINTLFPQDSSLEIELHSYQVVYYDSVNMNVIDLSSNYYTIDTLNHFMDISWWIGGIPNQKDILFQVRLKQSCTTSGPCGMRKEVSVFSPNVFTEDRWTAANLAQKYDFSFNAPAAINFSMPDVPIVKGKILDMSGNPKSGIEVVAVDTAQVFGSNTGNGKGLYLYTSTDNNGDYALYGVPVNTPFILKIKGGHQGLANLYYNNTGGTVYRRQAGILTTAGNINSIFTYNFNLPKGYVLKGTFEDNDTLKYDRFVFEDVMNGERFDLFFSEQYPMGLNQGIFLIKGISAGTYQLVGEYQLNLPTFNNHEAWYYPGTKDKDSAQTITVSNIPYDTISGYHFPRPVIDLQNCVTGSLVINPPANAQLQSYSLALAAPQLFQNGHIQDQAAWDSVHWVGIDQLNQNKINGCGIPNGDYILFVQIRMLSAGFNVDKEYFYNPLTKTLSTDFYQSSPISLSGNITFDLGVLTVPAITIGPILSGEVIFDPVISALPLAHMDAVLVQSDSKNPFFFEPRDYYSVYNRYNPSNQSNGPTGAKLTKTSANLQSMNPLAPATYNFHFYDIALGDYKIMIELEFSDSLNSDWIEKRYFYLNSTSSVRESYNAALINVTGTNTLPYAKIMINDPLLFNKVTFELIAAYALHNGASFRIETGRNKGHDNIPPFLNILKQSPGTAGFQLFEKIHPIQSDDYFWDFSLQNDSLYKYRIELMDSTGTSVMLTSPDISVRPIYAVLPPGPQNRKARLLLVDKNLTAVTDSTFTSITSAINAAQEGDWINIKYGLYQENTLTVNKELTFIGIPENGELPKIDLQGNDGFIFDYYQPSSNSYQNGENDHRAHNTLIALEIGGGNRAVRFDDGGLQVSNMIFRHNQIALSCLADSEAVLKMDYSTIVGQSSSASIGLQSEKAGVRIYGGIINSILTELGNNTIVLNGISANTGDDLPMVFYSDLYLSSLPPEIESMMSMLDAMGLPAYNLSLDPLFVNAAASNYHLAASSPLLTAAFSGDQMGAYNLKRLITQSVSIPQNKAPVLSAITDVTIKQNSPVSLTFKAGDPDLARGDRLTFSLSATPPSGVTLNSSNGQLSWTPDKMQVGKHSFTVIVTDLSGASDSKSFSITVMNVNDSPLFASFSHNINFGAVRYELTLADDDMNDSLLSYTYSFKKDTQSFIPDVSGSLQNRQTLQQNFYPLYNGLYEFSFTATDDSNAVISKTDVFRIDQINNPDFKLDQWQMVSLPGQNLENSIMGIVSDNPSDVSLFHWDESRNLDSYYDYYLLGSEILSIERSQGYWIRPDLNMALSLPSENQISLNPGAETLPIKGVWNQVGNPYPYEITAPSNYQFSEWNTDLRTYLPALTLKPWQGYWARLKSGAADANLIFDPTPVFRSSAASPLAKARRTHDPQGKYWTVNLSLRGSGSADLMNEAGILAQAETRYEPPRPFDAQPVSLYFIESATQERLETSILDQPAPVLEWEFALESSPGFSLQLLFENLETMPSHLFVYLRDKNNYINLKDDKAVVNLMNQYPSQYYGLVVTEQADYLDRVNKQFRLVQNYPNPFNPVTSIRFMVPQTYEKNGRKKDGLERISLRIYNLTGQLVRNLLDKELKSAEYEERWDAKDNRGSVLPTGVYLARMSTREFEQSIKMILLK